MSTSETNKKQERILFIMNTILGLMVVAALIAFFAYTFYMRDHLAELYVNAMNLYDQGEYEEAYDIFDQLGPYREAIEYRSKAKDSIAYNKALQAYESGEYESAIAGFEDLADFSDSSEKLKESRYAYAVDLYIDGKYGEAERIFVNLDGYADSECYEARCIVAQADEMYVAVYNAGIEYFNNKNYADAIDCFGLTKNYKDSADWLQKCEDILKSNTSDISDTIP